MSFREGTVIQILVGLNGGVGAIVCREQMEFTAALQVLPSQPLYVSAGVASNPTEHIV